MKILAGVKMVPKPTDMHFAPMINRIDRAQGEHQMNTHDRVAVDWALSLGTTEGDEVTVFTMGPPQARAVLNDALVLGAHRAVHMMDMRFSGADTLATARALARLCTLEKPDLLLLGRIATDGGTAQVAPQVAELLGLPLVTEAHELKLEGQQLAVTREGPRGREVLTVSLPAVVTLHGVSGLTDGGTSLKPASGTEGSCLAIEVHDVDTLGGDPADYGIRGSATYVHEIAQLPPRVPGPLVRGATAGAEQVFALASDRGSGGGHIDSRASDPTNQLWTIAECHAGGVPQRSAFEAIACAAAVAPQLGSEIVALALGTQDKRSADELVERGADKVLVVDSDTLSDTPCDPVLVARVLSRLVEDRAPLGVIGPWTRRGREYLPRTAASLGLGCTGDFVGLDVSEHRGPGKQDLVWLKPAWDGTVLARVIARTRSSMGTLRAGAVTPLVRNRSRQGLVEHIRIDVEQQVVPTPVIGQHSVRSQGDEAAEECSAIALETARVVICCGTRVLPGVEALRKAVAKLGWGVGVTHQGMVQGSFPPFLEVSRTRWALSPRVALVIAPDTTEDLVPLRSAHTLITADDDEHAEVFGLSDVCIACVPGDLVNELVRLVATVPGTAAR